MGMAFNAILVVMLVAWLRVAAGEVYKVGDSAGWSDIGPPDYKNWAATKTFRVGDTIKFEYNKEIQNVVRVTHKNFRACNTTAPYAIYATGDDSFTVRRTGHYYFICGYPGHCEKGQKVDIRVMATASPPKAPIAPITPLPFPPSPGPSVPVPSPAPSIPVPSPAPAKVLVPSPAPPKAPVPSPAPSKAPVPSPAPSKAPVPSPAPPKAPVPSPATPSVPVPSPPAPPKAPVPSPPAPPKVPVPSPAPPSVPVPSPPAPPSVPVQPPTQSPSPSSDLAPAPSPRKNGSSQYSVKIWLTLVAIVFGVYGLAF